MTFASSLETKFQSRVSTSPACTVIFCLRTEPSEAAPWTGSLGSSKTLGLSRGIPKKSSNPSTTPTCNGGSQQMGRIEKWWPRIDR
jgi:hypothetical protein